MANENYIEDLKLDVIDKRVITQREYARNDLDSELEALKTEFERRKFEIQDKYVRKISELNQYENHIQMSDFFCLSDVTNALSQMISNAEGEKYLSHETNIMDENGNLVKTIVSFVREAVVDEVDDKISYKYHINPEFVKEENPDYVYLTEFDEKKYDIRDYFYGLTSVNNSDIMVTFNPYNDYLDSRHVFARIYDPHFEYVNSFMVSATKTKVLYGFEKSDDFAQMAIVHGVGLYKKNNPSSGKGRIKRLFNKNQ